jgi:hypothetical protein
MPSRSTPRPPLQKAVDPFWNHEIEASISATERRAFARLGTHKVRIPDHHIATVRANKRADRLTRTGGFGSGRLPHSPHSTEIL